MKFYLYYYSYQLLQSRYKFVFYFFIYLLILYFTKGSWIYCMTDPDEIKNYQEALRHLTEENQMLQNHLQVVMAQNQELNTLVQKLLGQQQADIKQHEASIAAINRENQSFFDEARGLEAQLAQAHSDMGSLASSNIDLRLDQAAQSEATFASHRLHREEKKQLEETIDELQKQLEHLELRHKKR